MQSLPIKMPDTALFLVLSFVILQKMAIYPGVEPGFSARQAGVIADIPIDHSITKSQSIQAKNGAVVWCCPTIWPLPKARFTVDTTSANLVPEQGIEP